MTEEAGCLHSLFSLVLSVVCHPNSTVYQGGLSMITRGIVMYICLIESMHFSFPVYLRLIILKQKHKRKSLCL